MRFFNARKGSSMIQTLLSIAKSRFAFDFVGPSVPPLRFAGSLKMGLKGAVFSLSHADSERIPSVQAE